jgi:hypothetical protein
MKLDGVISLKYVSFKPIDLFKPVYANICLIHFPFKKL